MPTLENLSQDDLLELSRRTDPLGVVSVYADAERGSDPHLQAVAIDVKNRYRELRRRMDDDGAKQELSDALAHLQPQVEALTDPAESGRGRILFAGLSGGWTLQLDSPMSVPSRVVLDDGPFIHPLLELMDEGQPVGVLVASGQQARMLEWQLGKVRPLARLEQDELEASHERAGHLGGGPQGQFNSPVREQRQARKADRTEQFLDDVVQAASRLTEERGWQTVLVSGGDRWTDVLAAGFPDHLRERVRTDSRNLIGLTDARLTEALTDRLREEHVAREERLAERVREAAYTHQGALGLSEVTAALNRGRVSHLLYDPEVRYAGSMSSDGQLHVGGEPGEDGQPGTPEPRLTERLVEQAMATGARVTPVEGAAQGMLEQSEGVAALLRW